MNIEKDNRIISTPIQTLGMLEKNNLYIKREDLLPFSFGGNKARKAAYFFEEIKRTKSDCIITYGSNSSNHCRIIANMASSLKLKCIIISPEEDDEFTFNLQMLGCFGVEVIRCPISNVSKTINEVIVFMRNQGYSPYFIMGGGHGNLGTQAYVDCFSEVLNYEKDNNICFDYIFHASGTGTTQAGLVCGKVLNNSYTKIIGISIARKNPRGKQIVVDSVREYMSSIGNINDYSDQVEMIDDYVLEGYGKYNQEIDQIIKEVLIDYGIPLNRTYTGKAFWGMKKYLEKEKIENKNILFIHTGGTPLFFDYLRNEVCD